MVVERAFDLLAHKVGVAVRICQRQVEKAAGKEQFASIFSAFDAAIQAAVHSRDCQFEGDISCHDVHGVQRDTTSESSTSTAPLPESVHEGNPSPAELLVESWYSDVQEAPE